MRCRGVDSAGVKEHLQLLVNRELNGGEGHGHRESGRVGDVEGSKTLVAIHRTRTSESRSKLGLVHFHTLLDDFDK